jgi:hypothetical protein
MGKAANAFPIFLYRCSHAWLISGRYGYRITSSLSERTVILRSGGGEAAGATKPALSAVEGNLIVEALDNQKARFFGPSGASE